MTLSVGIVHGMPERDYRAAPGMSKSQLWPILRSPAHYKYHLAHPPEATAAMRFGSAFHCYLLERERFDREYAVGGPINPKTGAEYGSATKAYLEWACGRPAVTADDMERIRGMAEAVLYHEDARLLFQEDLARTEVSLFWDRDGRACKGRVDMLIPGSRVFIDVKTTGNSHPMAWNREAAKWGVFAQMAYYADGLERLTDSDWAPMVIAVEKEPPFAVSVLEIGAAGLTYGEQQISRALELLAECEASGCWPAFPGSHEINPPAWATIETIYD